MVELLGIGLLLLGLALVVAELTFPGYYIGVAGTVGVAIGLLQLAYPTFLTSAASGPVAALVAVIAAMASFRFYRRFESPIDIRGGTPGADLVGRVGIVRQPIRPYTAKGRVEIDGKLWGAEGHEPIENGSMILVESIKATHLFVRRQEASAPSSTPRDQT